MTYEIPLYNNNTTNTECLFHNTSNNMQASNSNGTTDTENFLFLKWKQQQQQQHQQQHHYNPQIPQTYKINNDDTTTNINNKKKRKRIITHTGNPATYHNPIFNFNNLSEYSMNNKKIKLPNKCCTTTVPHNIAINNDIQSTNSITIPIQQTKTSQLTLSNSFNNEIEDYMLEGYSKLNDNTIYYGKQNYGHQHNRTDNAHATNKELKLNASYTIYLDDINGVQYSLYDQDQDESDICSSNGNNDIVMS
ncbi:uncharacterized protein SCDLUD_000432 [Saccharomycodes ludwigii]|uniref:uncharacterized protein n=1 Tax=Saccharomycodes ludwigii TaxID=36035 RepID=UPI001E82741E|nr:hypothetical protein SCDLUD_000432 [Saccharomycodes ludwigii]KAH3902840.1 hypothetical protein SCDLUD_000432 [Saccharomycodes ludwigii]